jgi:hypothetical protein
MGTTSTRLDREEQGGGATMSQSTRPEDAGQEAHN